MKKKFVLLITLSILIMLTACNSDNAKEAQISDIATAEPELAEVVTYSEDLSVKPAAIQIDDNITSSNQTFFNRIIREPYSVSQVIIPPEVKAEIELKPKKT